MDTTAQQINDVICIASGKGGVGKTAISVNLATALVKRGHRVMLFDGDLGLANAQIAFGCTAPWNFSHVLSGEKSLQEIIVTTRQGVRLVPGGSGIRSLASLSANETSAIVQGFSTLGEEVDYLIIDAAAGISDSVMTFMQASQRKFVVLRDEPSSIADAYGVIKVLSVDSSLDETYVIPNMVESQSAGQALYRRLNEVCARFLGQPVKYLNSITYDGHMIEALRGYQTVVDYAPGGNAARDFKALARSVESMDRVEAQNGGIKFFFERLLQSAPK